MPLAGESLKLRIQTDPKLAGESLNVDIENLNDTLAAYTVTNIVQAGVTNITDANSTASVTLPQAISGTYIVMATINSLSGLPASGATRVFVTNKTSTGFDLNLEAAPGGGVGVAVGWAVFLPTTAVIGGS